MKDRSVREITKPSELNNSDYQPYQSFFSLPITLPQFFIFRIEDSKITKLFYSFQFGPFVSKI